MKQLLMILILLPLLVVPVQAQELHAPTVPVEAQRFMPPQQENFAQGLAQVLRDALLYLRPDLKEAAKLCLSIAAVVMAISVLRSIPGASVETLTLAGNVGIGLILLHSAGSSVHVAADTVTQISEYGKLLLPVMTAALAGQGGIGTSSALYAGTALFDALLSAMIGNVLTPMVYLYLLLAIAGGAIGSEMLRKLRDGIKWITVWALKTVLYIFTGYIGITGVVSGTTDAAALKAAKLTISGVVPVVGGILSDASEAVLVSAGAVKNAAGVYGLFAVIAIWIGPFLQIGCHYLLLKLTGALCSVFSLPEHTDLILNFSSAMGLLLAMTGAVCLIFLISLVCFLKGVG